MHGQCKTFRVEPQIARGNMETVIRYIHLLGIQLLCEQTSIAIGILIFHSNLGHNFPEQFPEMNFTCVIVLHTLHSICPETDSVG